MPADVDFLRFSIDTVHRMKAQLVDSAILLNELQCGDLLSKLLKAFENIQELIAHFGVSGSTTTTSSFKPALRDLYRISEKAKLIISNCCHTVWYEAAVFQLQNEEAFRDILLDLGLCYNVIVEQAKGMNICHEDLWNQLQTEDLCQSSTFSPAPTDKVRQDRQTLHRKLEDLANSSPSSPKSWEQSLAKYLVGKLKCISETDECLDMSGAISWVQETEPLGTWEFLKLIGCGSGASGVISTKWLGIPCAKKEFKGKHYEKTFEREAKVLARVNHPNIVKFLCCSNGPECFIGTELMEMSLSGLIKTRADSEGKPFPLSVGVSIIVQIARGMCYLHDLGIAHRDLKPSNVVVNKLKKVADLEENFSVKLVDFGVSKTEVEASKSNEISMPGVGTTTYRAPEVHPAMAHSAQGDGKFGKAHWLKADVYSFAVTCAEILTLNSPFAHVPRANLFGELMAGRRPELPEDCPEKLVTIIQDCWHRTPRSRPRFQQICSRLEEVRHDLLRGPPTPTSDPMSYKHVIESMLKNTWEPRTHTPIATSVVDEEEFTEYFDATDAGDQDPVGRLVKDLDSNSEATTVLKGLDGLVMFAKTPIGRLQMFSAGAIPALVHLLQTSNTQFFLPAVRLLEALTTTRDAGDQEEMNREDVKILLEVAKALDLLIPLMKEENLLELRFLAADTVANILVEKVTRLTGLTKDGIVPALFAFLVVDEQGQHENALRRAHRACVKGLTRLANTSDKGDIAQVVVIALLELVIEGHKLSPELVELVRDSLVSLERLVISLDPVTAASVLDCQQIERAMTILVPALQWHSTAPGRKSVVYIMRRMCNLYKNNVKLLVVNGLIINLLKVMTDGTLQAEVVGVCATLLKLCATHEEDMAYSVLTRHEEERRILEDILMSGGSSRASDEARLEIFLVLDMLKIEICPRLTGAGVAMLVNMAMSPHAACRKKGAVEIANFVKANQYIRELEMAGGIRALVALLEDSNQECQQQALFALNSLQQRHTLVVELPLRNILSFLGPEWEPEVQDAAVGLLGLMLNNSPDTVVSFVDTQGALEYTINKLQLNSMSSGSSKVALALLKMGVENIRVCVRILKSGPDFVKHIKQYGSREFKELLTSMLILSERAENCEETVMAADGHKTLLNSLSKKTVLRENWPDRKLSKGKRKRAGARFCS